MKTIELIHGKVKTLTFTFNVDVTGAVFTFICKDQEGTVKITKTDTDFDKTEIADSKVKIIIDTSLLDVGTHYIGIKTVWNEFNIDISKKYGLMITESVFD